MTRGLTQAMPLAALLLTASLMLSGCASPTSDHDSQPKATMETDTKATAPVQDGESGLIDEAHPKDQEATHLTLTIGDTTLIVALADNSSARSLAKHLEEGPITLELHDYGSFEKVGPLPWELPANDERITTEPGDVILYQGNQITLYYDVNTWDFTRLGRIEDVTADELREILGTGDVTMTLSR